MAKFHRAEFEAHIRALLQRLRFLGNGIMVDAIANSLGSELAIVGCASDSIAIEGDRVALETIQPELLQEVTAKLCAAFPGIIAKIACGIGHSWGETRQNAQQSVKKMAR